MKTSKWSVLILAATLITGGLVVFKTHAAPRHDRGPMRGPFLERAKQKLGLTEEQRAQIRAVLKADKDNLTSLFSLLHEARANLRAAIQASGASEASVRAASAKLAAVEADLAVERLKLHGTLSPILTVEQREKLNEFQAQMDDLADGIISRIGERMTE